MTPTPNRRRSHLPARALPSGRSRPCRHEPGRPARPASAPSLSLRERVLADGTLQLRLAGDLDLSDSGALRQRLSHLKRAGTHVVLDLSRITFVDCSGLRVILEALESEPGEPTVELAPGVSGPFRRLLALVDLGHLTC